MPEYIYHITTSTIAQQYSARQHKCRTFASLSINTERYNVEMWKIS